MSVTDGVAVAVTADGTRPPGVAPDLVGIGADITLLLRCQQGGSDFSTLAASTLTLFVAADVADPGTLSLQLVGGDWQPSQVTGATVPTLTGTAITVTPGALSAGDAIVFAGVEALLQAVFDTTSPWYGLAVTCDAATPYPVWTYNAADPDLAPSLDVTFADIIAAPASFSPASGQLVSARQVKIQLLDYAVGLGASVIDQIRMQWSTSTDFSSPAADDTQTISDPEWDMALATSNYQLPLNVGGSATMRYFRCAVKPTGGPWTDFGPPIQTGYLSAGSITITNPDPSAGVSTDDDPQLAFTYSGLGTQAYVRATRAAADDPTTLLADTGRLPSTTATADLGYEVLDYAAVTDTVQVWDGHNRADLPGAPAYATAAVTWGLGDDASVHPPENVTVTSLIDGSPYAVVAWTQPNHLDGYRVMANGHNVSGLLDPDDILVSEGEDGYHFAWTWFGAEPGAVYDVRVHAISDRRGSAGSDFVTFQAPAMSLWLASQKLGVWVELLNAEVGEWVRPDPLASAYLALEGDPFWRVVGSGLTRGLSTTIAGELWPNTAASAVDQRDNFLAMAQQAPDLVFTTPTETVPCKILPGTHSATYEDVGDSDNPTPYKVAATLYQTAHSTTTDQSTPQTVVKLLDLSGFSDGDPITTGDPDGLIVAVTGTVTADSPGPDGEPRSALFTDAASGATIYIDTLNRLNFYTECYFFEGVPSGRTADESIISLPTSSGQAGGSHIRTNGTFSLIDATGSQVLISVNKAAGGVPFRVGFSGVWADGVMWERLRVWIGANLEGADPDVDMSTSFACAQAPLQKAGWGPLTIWHSGDFHVGGIRVANTAAVTLDPLGVPESTLSVGYAHGSAMDDGSIRIVANGLVGADQAVLAYSTSVNDDGTPASPAFTSPVDIDADFSHAAFTLTGLSPRTRYYWAVADSDHNLAGGLGNCQTLYAPNASGTYKILQWSCQANGSASNQAWVDAAAYAADIAMGQGDFAYPGGAFDPWTPLPKMLDKTYTSQLARKPTQEAVLAGTSNEDQISDHEVCSNGQRTEGHTVDDWAGQLQVFQNQIVIMQKGRPVVFADDTGRARYYKKDLFRNGPSGAPSVRLIVWDCRGMDRSDGFDTDGPDKTFLGTPQLNWTAAHLLTSGLTIIADESSWLADPEQATLDHPAAVDKWWGFNWEQTNTIVPMLTGKQVIWWAGDRHGGGYLHGSKNTLGGFTVCLASAMEMHSLPQASGEIYLDADGTDTSYRFGLGNDTTNQQFGKISLSDDNAGTITHVWTLHDSVTGTDPIGPYTDTFTY